MIYIDGKQPIEKGQTKVIKYEHHIVTYKGVSLTSDQVTAHWRIHSITDLEGNNLSQLATESKRNGENKGPWHIKLQEEVKNLYAGVRLEDFIYDSDKNYRIADVHIPEENTVIEIQHSPMSANEFKERNAHYIKTGKKIAWIISPERATKHTGGYILSNYFKLIKGNFVDPLNVSRIQTFFESIYLEEQNIPIFLDVGWDKQYLQFCFLQPNNRDTYSYSLLFKVVSKIDILSILHQKGNIYENIRREVNDLCPLTIELKDTLIKIKNTKENFTRYEEQINTYTQLNKKLSSFEQNHLTNDAQLKAAIRYHKLDALGISSIDDINNMKNKLKKYKEEADSIISKLRYMKIREVPEEFEIFFKEAELEEATRILLGTSAALDNIIELYCEVEEEYYFKPPQFTSPFKLFSYT
jgi:competence CoiA-like predicted nuclease